MGHPHSLFPKRRKNMDFFNFLKWKPRKASKRSSGEILSKETASIANLELEQSLKLTKERYKCVSTVLEQHDKPCIYEFHTTAKGVPVFLCMDGNGSMIEIYNLNNNQDAVCRLRVMAEYESGIARIVLITGGMRMGHGRLAISRLVQYCAQSGIPSVLCSFIAPSKETAETFTYFFSKLGFNVSNSERNIWEAYLRVEPSENVPKQS